MLDRFRPEGAVFYFRVSYRGSSHDIASVQHATLADAYAATVKCYPGATVSALDESKSEVDRDGLPKERRTRGW